MILFSVSGSKNFSGELTLSSSTNESNIDLGCDVTLEMDGVDKSWSSRKSLALSSLPCTALSMFSVEISLNQNYVIFENIINRTM